VIHILNIVFGLVPTMILAGSIAAGIEDDRNHRRIFVLVYGLWSITLAMWNWMRSAPAAWIVVWSVAGIVSLGAPYALLFARRYPRRAP
jgi:hypothetical protein